MQQSPLKLFSNDLNILNIEVKININKNQTLLCWKQDIDIIFANLIENSIYWLSQINESRKIEIYEGFDEGKPIILYKDNGPGIDVDSIKSNAIFEPGFTKKTEGTGLGLSIAGEAADRNGLELKAQESDEGALFLLLGK